jgi:hypothetical protein
MPIVMDKNDKIEMITSFNNSMTTAKMIKPHPTLATGFQD